MTDEKAKYILHEIKSLRRYKKIIEEIDCDLRQIHQQIMSVSEPSSPQGHAGQPSIQSHADKSSIVNSLMSDEWTLIKEREEFINRKKKAEDYYTLLKVHCNSQELDFADAFFRGVQYKRLVVDYHYENPYQSMIVLIKKITT